MLSILILVTHYLAQLAAFGRLGNRLVATATSGGKKSKGAMMKQEIAEKAAKWWADQLRGNAKLDHGDDSPAGGWVIATAIMLQGEEKSRQPDGKIDAFEQALARILANVDRDWFTVSVDYHPDSTLLAAAKGAQLELGMTTLPWKTVMWIEGNTVSVACGYGAPAQEI